MATQRRRYLGKVLGRHYTGDRRLGSSRTEAMPGNSSIARPLMPQTKPKIVLVGALGDLDHEARMVLEQWFDLVDETEAELEGDRPSVLGEAEVVAIAPDALRRLLHRDLPDLPGSVQPGRVLHALGEGVCICTEQGDLIWANPRFDQLPEAARRRVQQICADTARFIRDRRDASFMHGRKYSFQVGDDRFYEMIASAVATDGANLQSGPPIEIDLGDSADRGMRRDGRDGRDGVTGTAGDGPPGSDLASPQPSTAPLHIAAIVWDNSRGERLQRKLDAIDRAGSELVRIESEAIASLNTAERLALLEDKIIKYSRDLMNFDHFAIYLLDRKSKRLLPVMTFGLPEAVTEYELYASKTGSGISGHVAATGKSYICPDVRKDPRYLPGLETPGSSLSVPLQLHDEVVGVFNIESATIGCFTEDDRQFAEIFGRYIALALNILDLLLVERCTTSGTVAVNVIGEISHPLNDITAEAEALREILLDRPEQLSRVDHILDLVQSVRRKVQDVAKGPRSILGIQEAMEHDEIDPVLAHKHILVCDDEPNIRETIRSVLLKRGSRVTVAASGGDAIDLLKESHPGDIDLVLSDINMPDRNGYEVFAGARKMDATIPVILMTGFGYDPHHSIVRASQEGLQCVLFKPFQVDQLLSEVSKALSAPNSR